MSTQRRIRRSNEKLKTKQVETAVEKRPKLAQRIISAVTAMGIFANPLVASAQIISGAEFTNVTTNGSVIDIETKKIIDRTGVNVFQQFGLNANQIANMYFGSKDSNNQADNLVNFVNSHIDINGTVNAVKNNKIGGNLYFLSKDGMAVGSSGVINTGALHVMTPTAAQMTAMQNVLSAGTNDAQKAQLELLRNSPAQIPLNPSGTITVLGKINATNKIDLRAANILVGIDGNKNINKAAALNTGVVDFTDLVNIQGSSGAVQSGLTGALTATMDTGSGDIILKASADAGTKSIADGAPGFIKDKLDGLADEVTYREITASVQNYGTIAAAGGVDISATAQNVKRTETGAEEAGSLAQVTATVDLAAGSVSGVKDVTVQAVAKNEYVDEDGLVHKAAVLGLGAATPITGDVAFAVLETEAAVNIGQEAAVSSSGGDVAITAESTTLAATQASATGYKFASKGGQKGTYVPAGAVTYTEASNKAVVNVDGKVNAQGDVEVKAKADLKIDATDNLAVKGENANQIVVGVLVTNGDNTAQVNINKNQTAGYEKALTAGGDIVIGAEAVNDLNSELNVAGADASALVTAVNVTTYNSRAGVNVDRSLEAGNDLSVSADNTFTKNTVISRNKIGSGKYMAKAMETLNKVGATDALKAVGGKVKDALFKSDGEGGADGMTYEGIKLADFLKAGATVAVVNENNTAAVNIGSEAGLTAQEGQLTLDARMQMDDIHMVASGASNSYTKEHGGGLVGNATVMVTNLEDTATVTVADRSETNAQPAALTGKKGVAVNSRVLVDYNRVQKMVDDVKRAAADIKAGFSGLGGSISSDWEALLKAVTDKADALEAALGTFTADETLLTSDDGILKATNPFSAATELLSALDTLNEQIAAAEKDPAQQTTAAKLKQAVSGLSDIVVNSIAFADPNSYANFAAVSNAKGDDGGGSGTGTAATIAGTVMITNVDHGSKVLLGNNVQINSEGTVDVGAENLMKDVSLAGVTAAIFNNAGGNSSVGATVNIADFDTNTVVAVGEGSHITGGEINIAGTNTIDHVAVAASAGKGASGEAGASGVTLNGMVSVISGDSKVLTIVDDEASLTAQQNGSGAAETSGKVTVKGLNDTSLVNVAGGLSMTHSNGAVGIGVAVNDFAVHNIAGIGSRADVSVRAGDYTNSAGFVGSLGIGVEGAGIGAGSDTNTVSRDVTAQVADSDIKAQALKVAAEGKQGISSFTVGMGAAGVGAGVAGVVTVSKMDNTTKAVLTGATADVTTLDVEANHLARTNAGNISTGGAGVGAGIGLSVGVLQDDSVTEAEVSGSTVNSSGNQSITATNKTVANPAIAATGVAGAGAGVAGAVSVNNINSKVKTNITNAALTAANGSIAVAAKNTVAIDAYTGGIAAGAVGVGASVTVNTIDSTVQSNVTNSNLTAQKDITVTAEEFRDISQLATNAAAGGAAVGGNILITNVGKALNDADENEQAAREQIEAANAAYGDTDMLSFARDLGALEKGSIEADANTVSVGAGFGGGRDSQISVNIKDGSMTAQGNLAATAKETGDITMTGGSGAVGSAAVNAGVGILNVHRDLAVKIEDAMLTGAEIKVGSDINGATQLNMYQGSGGILGVNAAYGRVSTEGGSDVKISGSSLTATKNDVAVTANDSSSTSIEAVGISGGAVALGVIVAQAENTSNIGITVDKSSLKAEKNVDISAERKARDANGKEKDYSLSVNAIAGSGGLVFAGAGVSAQATENGTVKIDVTSQNSLTAGKDINITALNAPAVKAVTGAISGSMLASAAVTVAQANIGTSSKGLQTSVTIGDNNILTAGSEAEPGAINVKAEANARQYVDMQALSISASPFPGGAAQINSGGSSIYSKVSVNAGNNIYRGYALGDDNYEAADLRLEANNSVAQQVKASGISVGTAFATGTNLAATLVDLTTEAIAAGSKSGSHINDLAVSAKSYADINSEANGYGGALVDISPYAAKVENEYRADTDARVSGNWDTDGAVTVSALNGSTVELHSDAVRAAVIGGSGVWLKNAISNDANTTVSSATISSDGTQTYTAQNNVDYTGKIDASGYGGLNINASNLEDDFVFNAGVNIDESTLTGTGAKGSITAQALTQGTIDSTNSLKSAGVIPVSLAFSKHDIAYNNDITVNGSILKTAKKDQDITLAASDDTEVRLETIADTQGGAIGAASAKAENSLQRSNKLKVAGNSYLESTNDVNLYAGSNSGGINSSLDLEVLADAYNKTALPVYTDPSVKNTMVQSNQVMIAGGSTVGSVRHVNVKAGKGKTTVTESAREYNIYTGTGGSGSVASTALGENIKSETADNYADISGVVKSGIHNKLQVDIGGATKTTAPTYDENGNLLTSGGVSYEGITITIGEGSDWFDAEELTPAAIVIINGLFDRYKEVSGLMQDYLQGSDEYNAYKNELSSIVLEMRNAGMVALDQNGNQTDIPVDQINVAAIKLPDIVVSGGNINIEADKLQGTGSMTAQGAPQLTINNSSDLYLAVGDLTIKDAGGQLKFNESDLKSTSSGNNFTGTTKADGLGTDAPTITVNSNSSSAFAGNPSPQADIGIFGDITNTAGDIKVNNDNYNVLVQGNISGRNITLSAVNGSVTQTSSEGLINIGGDPVTRYQFSDAVAKKIQNYLYQKGSNVTYTFNSYEEYKNWLINTVGIDAAELNYTVDESAGIVAGDNVYISGLNVNIGGLVQSGYGSYSTELSAADASKVAALDAGWAANQRPLSDNEVMSNEAYCINGGGKVWNSTTKVWDYEVKVYYNPYTKQLLTDSITPNGGKIYITGKISSTGNGRLMAMDGAADISINTAQIDRAVKVNTITNNDISGLISITDKNTNLVTEYMNGQQRSYAVGTATVNLPAWTAGADTYTYTPKNGLQYQWTGGVSGETTKKYSYSEKFLFWGLLDYGNTGEFVAGLNRDGKTYTYTTSSGSGQSLATGSVITTGNLSNQFKISSNYYNTGTEQYSEVTADKRYDGTAGKIFGYGTTYYYWTGKQGTANSSTSSLKADYGIDIGFLGNGQGSGNINVTSNQDMVLAGNISNAAVIDNSGDSNYKGLGNVTLTSNHGAVTSLGNAKINSDDVVVRADTGIQVNHAAIGSKATVDAATNDGNINFLSDRGDLNIVRMVTGGSRAINAETGNIYLQAEGSIFDTAGGSYAIKGQRIDLLSRTGTIGTKGQSLRVLGGSELFSGDSMTSSVNATAQGDIVLTQTSGNMRLGTIESANGDAVLTVADGSFVDAYNEDSVGLSDSAAKVDRWLENGLISSADADDSSSQAAEDAKAERLAGLDSRAEALAGGEAGKIQAYKDAAQAYADDGDLQTAKAVYIEAMQKADGISDATEKNEAITDAYTAYQQAQENYFANTGYSSDEQNLVASYAEVSSSGNYGWSKNQLLYAIQESVINSKPGQVQTVAKANVTANNITLTAANGGIGVDAADRVINYADLGQLENLQLLASAKAGDLTWNAEANTVTFRQQRAINLQTRDQGEIHATGRDNVYLAGTKDTVFNISGIETQNDIKLMSDNGVHMIGTGLLQGKNLIIYGGNGSIGSEDKHIETKLSGTLDANSAKSVYLTQKDGVLTIQAVSAGEEVAITAADGMQMSTEEGKDMGYISAGTQISLASEKGDIGIADNGVRILNNGAVINADGKNINLAGKESGSLVLGNINAEGAFTLNSAGNVSLGRAQVENSEGQVVIPAVMGQVTAQDSGVINAVNIALDHGGITVNDTEGQLLLQATGNITQNAAADGIRVKSLTAVTGGGQSLLSQNNEISNFSAQSIGQDNSINGGVEFVSNAAAGLTVQLNNLQVKEGNVSISNIATGGAMVIKGGINAAVGNIEFSGKGDLSTEGVLQAAENIKMTASGSIINHDNVTAGAMLDMQAGKDITNNSTVEAGEDLTMTAEGSIANKDTINAGGVVMLQAQTDISNSAAVTSGTGFGISMTAVTGGIANKGSVISGADVALKAQQDIFNEDDIRADAKILMEAAERDIVNQGSLTAGAEDVAIDLLAGRGDILNTNSSAAITAVGTVQMQAQAGNIGNAATIASGTGADVLLTADGNIVNSGAIGSGRLVSFAAGSNISNTAAITAVDSITMTAGNDINNSDMLTAGSSVILTAGNDIGNTAAITAAEAITMDAASDITSDGTLTAVKDVQLIADGGNINIDDGGTVTSKQGSINLVTKNTGAAGQGAITVNAALDAKNAINVLADHGDVFIGADATAQDGILTVNVAEGNIKSNHFDGGENPGGSDVKLTSVNGSVDIYTGKGDVDLHEVYAKDKASVGTENGHLRLCKIDGNIVVLIIKDMDNNMDVKEIIAGNQIVISGNKISLDDIKQRDDADGMLIISPGGADADEPIESFNIKNINTGNGVRFDKLWVKNADLHVDSGRFYIDKLAVVDVAHFSNRDMRTAVYGTPALRDGSDSIYWYDHAANDPKHDLLGWHNDNYLGNWMHLYFTDKYRTQISNGVLLSLKDHYYAHNQRFTGEDHLRFLKKEMPLDVHEKNNNPRISLYQRFALYELPEAEQQEGAEASIVVAEDV